MIWAFCWWVLVKDKPSQVSWLAESEKAALQEQLDREQQGIKAVRNYGEAFRSRNVILLCAQYFCLEYRRIRLCTVATVDYPQRR